MTAREDKLDAAARDLLDEQHLDTLPGRSASRSLSPEALLTWDSVRQLEQHTDIGPGNVGPLLIEVNLRQHEHTLAVLREAGYGLWRQITPEEEALDDW